jgi:hypothetical protein
MQGMPTGLSTAMILVALAMGYIVCYLANREEKGLRRLGYTVGIVIIVFSGLLLLNKLVLARNILGAGAKGSGKYMMQRKAGQYQRPMMPQK